MFSKKEKIGTTLSLILSLCLMLTGVFFGLPAIGSFAAENDGDYLSETFVYTSESGEPMTPTVTLLDEQGFIIPTNGLEGSGNGKEYNYQFNNNTRPGEASITITDVAGGNYNITPTSFTKYFTILSASSGVSFTKENPKVMKPGDVIKRSEIDGFYTKEGGVKNEDRTLVPTDIYLCEASKWESNKSKDNTNLTDEITIPDNYTEPLFSYYIVVVNNANGEDGYYAYPREVATAENRVEFDDEKWYSATENDVTWNYKLNRDGNIVGLYTQSSIAGSGIISNGVLNVPAKVNGRTVIAIGSDSKETPFIPVDESAWDAISFPDTVKTINNYAFYGNKAQAEVVIPTTINRIGDSAFYGSHVKKVTILEMSGDVDGKATIATAAFNNMDFLKEVYIKGGNNGGLIVSSLAFADNDELETVTIKGYTDIHERAFDKDPKIKTLNISGTSTIGAYAFNGAVSLEELYLPAGVTLKPYAFNGATGLTSLESDTSLVSNSFAGSGNINLLLLDPEVEKVAYDWEGNINNILNRSFWIKNSNMLIGSAEIEDEGGNKTYYSAFGDAGDIVSVHAVTGIPESNVDLTLNNGVLEKSAVTYKSHGEYEKYYTANKTVTIDWTLTHNGVQGLDVDYTAATVSDENPEGKVSILNKIESQGQTDINAYYTDKLLTSYSEKNKDDFIEKDIEKNKMKVIRINNGDEGNPYNNDEFYIIRKSDFQKAETDGTLTEDYVKSLEPVYATDADLKGSDTGIFTVTVVVFDENAATHKGYYWKDVSIRLEKYTAKSDIEQAYGSYEAIATRLATLDKQIADLSEALGSTAGSTEEIAKLTKDIAKLKESYVKAVNELKNYTENNVITDNSGYMGTEKIGNEEKDVIYINGDPTPYREVVDLEGNPVTDSEGNKIYEVEYDTNGDKEAEVIYVIVKPDGVHQVIPIKDENENITSADSTDVIWADNLAALQRQMTAELAAMQAKINSLSSMLNNITNTINENTGEITIDPTLPIDEQTLAIINEINRLYDAEAELDAINTGKYTDALNTIYSKLAGKNFTEEELGDLDNVLNTINAQIEKDKTEIESSKATIEDIKEALSDSEARSEELKQKIDENAEAITAKETEIKNKDAAIATANKELETLRNQLDEATDPETIATLNGKIELKEAEITSLTNDKAALENEKTALEAKAVTLAQAQNTLVTLQGKIAEKDAQITQLQADLAATGATAQAYSETVRTAGELFKTTDDARIAEAIRNYVSANATMSTTIGKIQQAVNSTNNGDALVADINAAIAGAGSGSGTAVPDEATLTAKYNEGYAAGLAASTTATEKEKLDAEYTKGYNAGYAAAPKTSTTDTASLNAKYNEGYNAGVSSVNTTSYYNNGYNAGYTAGLKAGSGTGNTELTTQVTSLTSQVTSLTTENTKLAGQVSTLKTDNAALKTELDSLKTNNTELSGKVNDLTNNNTELTGKVDDLTGKNQSLSGQVNDLTTRNNDLAGQITSLNGQVATLKANNNRTTNTGTGNTGNTATNTANTNANSNTNTGTNTTRPTDVTSAANTNNGTANNGTTAPAANNQGTTGRTSGTSATSAATSSAGRTSATSSATSASPLYGNLSSTPSTGADARSIKITQFENAGTAPASGQVATVNLVKLANADTKGIKTNAMKSAPITDADKEEAEIVINYYMNHLSELGNLGSTEISNAAKDDTKNVAFNEVLAADFTASDAQNKEITEKGKTSLTIASDDIVNGGTYLAIHKSNKRSGMYDVLLTKASGNEIAMTLQDLSPVTIVKVSVAPIGGTAAVADKSVTETAPAKNMSKLWIAIGICAAVVGAFIFLMVLIKMRGKKRDRMEPAYAGDGNGDFEEVDDQYEDDYEDDPEPYDEPNQG